MVVNVLHISPSKDLGGSRNSLLTLVQAMDRTRYNSIIALPGQGAVTAALDEIGVPWVNICIEPFRKGKYWCKLPYEIKTLRQAIAEHHIGLIHCNEHFVVPHALTAVYNGSIMGGLFAYLRGDNVALPQTLPIVSHMRLFVRHRHVINYRLRHVQRVIAVSQNAKADFASFSWCEDKVRAIYNAVNLEPYRQALSLRQQIRSEIGLSNEDILFGAIGMFSPRKRTQLVLEAFDAARAKNPHLKLLVIGEARHHHEDYYRRMVQYIADQHLDSSVILLPWQDNPAVYLAALDINLLMSSEEGFSRVIIESGACGVPTIASNIAPNREAVTDCATGWLVGEDVKSDEEDAFRRFVPVLSDKMLALAQNLPEVRRIGSNMRSAVETKFSAAAHAVEVMNVFDEAMEDFRRQFNS